MSRGVLICRCLVVLVGFPATAGAQMPSTEKVATALPLAQQAPVIDGRIDAGEWSPAVWFSDFQDKEPVEGAVPRFRTEVAFLYDAEALYVAARMETSIEDPPPTPVTRRDQVSNAEHLIISLDTYHDRRTGVSFVVSSGGVRTDYYHPSDNEGNRDFGYDPVWQARVSHQPGSWTAEMRIPFSQLRFSPGPEQIWGLNVNRWIPAQHEDIYWVVIPKAETGFFSRFGTLRGIRGIRPTRRLELLPYVAGDARFTSDVAPTDPFRDGSDLEGRAGLDLKLGLGPNLTLDATVNPDFGQVEADPAEVNLSAFETFFPERRPFFLEGSRLLAGNGPGYFYSRRIGAAPRRQLDGTYTSAPDHSTILGAAKLSGRLASGLSIGALVAVTDREVGRAFDSTIGRFTRGAVAPLSGYAVVRGQQEFGPAVSTVGWMMTAVERDVSRGGALAGVYPRRAWTTGADWILRFSGGAYEIGGHAGLSYVAGDPAAIVGLQTASQRYYQRPDQHYVRVDSSRTSLSGYAVALRLGKNAGSHWLYGVGGSVESPGFELNDVGRLIGADDIDASANLRYREIRPGRVFHRWSVVTHGDVNWNYGGIRTASHLSLSANGIWRNFWSTNIGFTYDRGELSDLLTRGGPLMRRPATTGVDAGFSTTEGASQSLSAGLSAAWDEAGGWEVFTHVGLTARPAPPLAVSIQPSWYRSLGSRQYIATDSGGTTRTYGSRYVFGYIERSTISVRVRVNYALTPDLTLEGYIEPFSASGRYRRIGELRAARSGSIRRYGTDGTSLSRQPNGDFLVTDNGGADTVLITNPDFNRLSLRSNLVLRWEWRPGSTLFLVWQQNRDSDELLDRQARLGDLGRAFGSEGDQFFALKLTYWLSGS